jgi:hypothetical protein
MTREVRAPADVTPDLVERAVEIADGFYGDGPIEWEGLVERLESWCDVAFPEWGTATDALQRRVRAARSAGT